MCALSDMKRYIVGQMSFQYCPILSISCHNPIIPCVATVSRCRYSSIVTISCCCKTIKKSSYFNGLVNPRFGWLKLSLTQIYDEKQFENLNYLYKLTQERNSATLLLSALVTRIFGVPRSKSQDQLSWKNKMTGRIFFQRYPKLFEFFQQELRKASQSASANLHPSLYPVLLILGRLYPSSLEGTDSNVQVSSRNTCHKSSFISLYFSNHS